MTEDSRARPEEANTLARGQKGIGSVGLDLPHRNEGESEC